METNRIELVSPCLFGLEGPLAGELRRMGAADVRPQNGRVFFAGGPEMIARANLRIRYGERVLVRMGAFPARSFDELFEGVRALPWERWIGRRDAFPVKGSCVDSKLASVPDCQSIVKKAIVERLKGKYSVQWFEETGPVRQVQFFLRKDLASLMIDTSGAGLHKRGYRPAAAQAPIRETLAAAMAYFSRVRHDAAFYDPCCGSGTLLIEAALYALNIAPGLGRRFSAEHWDRLDASVWKRERESARALEKRDASFSAKGSDIDPAAVALTLENAARAGVADRIRAEQRDIADFREEGERGCVICNPPYGERMLDLKSAERIYRTMGRVFRSRRGWSYAVISPDDSFERCFGRPASRRRKLYNGMIRCQYHMYFDEAEKP
ncbi:MAG TPA: RNA methyltransferase [Ruminococcaceae bacterium]|jgi:putative N6-adenine-specific DNA methylase|nr:RNA methyltransferase [Oscillospiraceae bacterium]HCB90804.1 RNA methyltransferase [Oscillospiraceae bacterium]